MHAGQIPLLNEFLFSCRPQKWQKGGVFFLILFQHPKQMISSILALSVSLALQEIQTLGYIKSSKLFQKFPGIGVIISVKSVFVKKYCCFSSCPNHVTEVTFVINAPGGLFAQGRFSRLRRGRQRSFVHSAPAQLARRLSPGRAQTCSSSECFRVRIPSLTQATLAKTSIRSQSRQGIYVLCVELSTG